MAYQKNWKFDHAFAIIRLDQRMAEKFGLTPDVVSVTRVVWSEDEAEREVERLNRLNTDKGAVYFWRLTRLERSSKAEDTPPSTSSTVVEERAVERISPS